jgi:polyphosphate kinase
LVLPEFDPLRDEARPPDPPIGAAESGGALTKKRDVTLDDPSLYINRELSMLEFHRRVVQQAQDPRTPVLERMRFLAISSSILDEFFEIRVGGLKEQVAFGLLKSGPDGLGPQETLTRIRREVLELVTEQYRLLNSSILPALEANEIAIYRR